MEATQHTPERYLRRFDYNRFSTMQTQHENMKRDIPSFKGFPPGILNVLMHISSIYPKQLGSPFQVDSSFFMLNIRTAHLYLPVRSIGIQEEKRVLKRITGVTEEFCREYQRPTHSLSKDEVWLLLGEIFKDRYINLALNISQVGHILMENDLNYMQTLAMQTASYQVLGKYLTTHVLDIIWKHVTFDIGFLVEHASFLDKMLHISSFPRYSLGDVEPYCTEGAKYLNAINHSSTCNDDRLQCFLTNAPPETQSIMLMNALLMKFLFHLTYFLFIVQCLNVCIGLLNVLL